MSPNPSKKTKKKEVPKQAEPKPLIFNHKTIYCGTCRVFKTVIEVIQCSFQNHMTFNSKSAYKRYRRTGVVDVRKVVCTEPTILYEEVFDNTDFQETAGAQEIPRESNPQEIVSPCENMYESDLQEPGDVTHELNTPELRCSPELIIRGDSEYEILHGRSESIRASESSSASESSAPNTSDISTAYSSENFLSSSIEKMYDWASDALIDFAMTPQMDFLVPEEMQRLDKTQQPSKRMRTDEHVPPTYVKPIMLMDAPIPPIIIHAGVEEEMYDFELRTDEPVEEEPDYFVATLDELLVSLTVDSDLF